MLKKILSVMIVLVSLGSMAFAAEGSWTPSKTIKLIVPWSAGGGTDTLARALAKHGKKYFGVPVVVENVEGAMGAVGAMRVKNAKPDGYKLLVMSGFVSWIGMVQDYPVKVEDFTPVMNLNRDPAAFALSIDSDIKNLADLQAYCIANPGKFTVSHSGEGTTWHVAGASLADYLGVEMNFVPFNGTAPGIAALMGKKINGVSGGAAEFVSQAKGNQIRVLTVLAEDRFAPLPETKTAKEQGYDLEFYTTRGLVAPKSLDSAKAQALADGFSKIMKEPEFVQIMENIGLGIYPLPPKKYSIFLDNLVETSKKSLEKVGLL